MCLMMQASPNVIAVWWLLFASEEEFHNPQDTLDLARDSLMDSVVRNGCIQSERYM